MCMRWRQAVVIAGCALLSACILKPDYQRPNVSEPPDFNGANKQVLD